MKAVMLTDQSIEYVKLPAEPLLDGWARIRVSNSGLCGTDVAKLVSHNLPANHTRILGHEFTGQVAQTNKVGCGIAVGDWVVCMPIIPCGECQACTNHKENLCVKADAIDRTIQGAFSEFVNVPAGSLYKVAALHDSYVLTDSLAVCLHAAGLVKRTKPDAMCLVIGDGTIGCLLSWLLLTRGHKVAVRGIHPENLRFVEKLGADVLGTIAQPRSFDEVYETVGRSQPETLNEGLAAVKAGGSVVVLGVYAPGYNYALAARELFIKESTLLGANAYVRTEFQQAAGLIDDAKDKLSAFISHSFPLSQFNGALAAARNKRGFTMKIMLKPDGGSP